MTGDTSVSDDAIVASLPIMESLGVTTDGTLHQLFGPMTDEDWDQFAERHSDQWSCLAGRHVWLIIAAETIVRCGIADKTGAP